jgi:hypothetical protein
LALSAVSCGPGRHIAVVCEPFGGTLEFALLGECEVGLQRSGPLGEDVLEPAERAAPLDGHHEQFGQMFVGESLDVIQHVLVGGAGTEAVDAQDPLTGFIQVDAFVVPYVLDDALYEDVVVRQGDELVPTLAGLLAFGVYPQRFEPQLDVTVVAYPTIEAGGVGGLGERFTENRSVDGPIPLMVSECIRVLKRNMRRRSIISGLFRQDEWEYPEEVLREVLVNALVNRDYSEFAKGMQVQVEIYPDRLVMRNPGGLYGPVELTALGDATISPSRNRALLKILEDTPLGDGHMVCENRGTGIARMRRVMVKAGMEQPRFTDAIATFQAEFPNHTILDQETIDWLGSISVILTLMSGGPFRRSDRGPPAGRFQRGPPVVRRYQCETPA